MPAPSTEGRSQMRYTSFSTARNTVTVTDEDVPAQFETLSGIPVDPVYGDGPGPGEFPYTRGPYASMYRAKPWTMRMFAGFGSAADTNQRFRQLLDSGGTGLSTAFDMPTLMGRDSDDPLGHRRGGQGRRRHRHPRRHGHAVRRHRPGRGVHVDDHQRPRGHHHGDVRGRGRRPGHAPGRAVGHDPERHPQGVPGPEGVPVPAPAVAAPGHRPDPLHHRRDAPVPPGVDLRLPHPRGGLDGGPGAGVHAGQRVRLRRGGNGGGPRRGRLRPPALLLLQRPPRLLRGDRQVPGGPADLGPLAARPVRRHRRALAAPPVPHPDRRRVAHRPAARSEHRPGRHPGPVRRPRRHAEPAHRLLRRGPRPARRRRRPASPCAPSRSSPTRPG